MDAAKAPAAGLDPCAGCLVEEPQAPREPAGNLFASIVVPHLADAYLLARWLTRSCADAQDVVQEASLRAWRAIETYRHGSARAWMMTIVRNTAYDWLRKNRPADVLFAADLADFEAVHTVGADEWTPEAVLMRTEDAALVGRAIRALPVIYREALVLREIQGFSYREIAQVSKTSIGTTMSRLFRARRQLGGLLVNPAPIRAQVT